MHEYFSHDGSSTHTCLKGVSILQGTEIINKNAYIYIPLTADADLCIVTV